MKNKPTAHKLNKDLFEQVVKQYNPNLDIIGEYKNLHSPITYHCKVCDFTETIKEANSLYRGLTGCGCCSGRKIVKGVNDLGTTHPWLIPYFVDKELIYTLSANSVKVVKLQCPICHTDLTNKVTYIANRTNICPICGDTASFGEKIMKSLLDSLNVKYVYDNSTDWSCGYRYDFIIEDNKIIFEVDGKQHEEGGWETSSYEQNEIDKEKDKLAVQYGYRLIRIPYYKSRDIDYVINSITDNVKDVFDLSNVSWNEIIHNTLFDTTLIKVSELWKNKSISQKEMSEQLHMGQEKLRNYLKVADKIGLIKYNPKDNQIKTQILNLQSGNAKKMKQVMCINDGKIFKSCASAERYYGLTVGKSVGRVCNGKRKSIKGLKFIFINKGE